MFQFIFLCLKNFGLLLGLIIYLRIKILKAGKINIPGLIHPIHFRAGSSDIHTFREIFLRAEYDIKLPDSHLPKIIIDAGANIGFTTLFLSKQYPTAKIFSLEPNGENYELLKKNTIGYPNIYPIQSALWNTSGTIEILDKGFGVRGYVVENTNNALKGQEMNKPVTSMPSTTMAELVQKYQLSSIDILKIDIEGSEKEVFSADIEKWLPITKCLIIELHDRMKPGCSQAVFKALADYNFECSIRGENLVFRTP